MKLSRYFDLMELTASKKAVALGIDNTPDPLVTENLRYLAAHLLDGIRDLVERPVGVSSGFRCPTLNKAVGGEAKSQHQSGMAADIYCLGVDNLTLAKMIADSDLPYDQIILEPSWVHVSCNKAGGRRQVLHKLTGGYAAGLPSRWPL